MIGGEVTVVSTEDQPLTITRERGGLYGAVIRQGETLMGGVKVEVLGTDFYTYTDPTGGWILDSIPTGTYTVSMSSHRFA